jgi:DNA polymerase-3 subunit gamma/tau
VLGQAHVTRTLRNAIATDKIAHAYLFCGPRGTGKTSIARILFRAMNCLEPMDGDACGRCEACIDEGGGQALDLVEIDAASNRGIDHIRELRERVWIAPGRARRKMYILDEAHQLSAAAWDAFLKTLEEPPSHVVFVLATTEVHKVPGTILSRCQRFDLGRLSVVDLVEHLRLVATAEGLEVEPGVLERVARQAKGGVRDALGLLEQLGAYGHDRVTNAMAREVFGLSSEESLDAATTALRRGDARGLLELLANLAREGLDLHQFVEDLVAVLRALLLARVGAAVVLEFELGAEAQSRVVAEAVEWEPAQLVNLIRRLSALDARARDPAQFQTDLELALLEGAAESLDGGAPERGPNAANPLARLPLASAASSAAQEPGARAGEGSRGAAGHEPAPDGGEVMPPTLESSEARGNGISAPEGTGRRSGTVPLGDASTTAPPGDDGASPRFEVASVAAATDGLVLAVVRQRWTELKEAVAAELPAAGIALEAAAIGSVEGNALYLTFTSEFHQRSIEEQASRAAVEAVLTRALGTPCRVLCGPADARQPTFPGDDFLQQAAEMFGALGFEPVDDESIAEEERRP